jgi:signal transduction histidine kinase
MPVSGPSHSERRIMRVVIVSQWVALALGIVAGIVVSQGSSESFIAAATAGIYVLVMTAVPLHVLRRPLVVEGTSLTGSLLTMTAVTLTGGLSSPYLLLAIIPPVSATVLGGMRAGAATGTLSAALLVAVSLSNPTTGLVPAIATGALFLVVVLTVGQIRKLLHDIETKARALEEHTEEADRRLEELSSANELLTRLAALATENSGPIGIGRAALETITSMIPGSAGTAILTTPRGPVVIAQHGDGADHPVRTRFPLHVGEREVGAIVLASDDVLRETERASLTSVIEPVALSFANLLLLQQIAGTAVAEERSRLARELHDEIGPTLASLGLSLDTAVLQAGEPDLASHLGQLRASVTHLVDDVRATVADLRIERRGTLANRLRESILHLPPPPSVDVVIDERRPPRPSMMDDLSAIVIEAVRNAHRHSGSVTVRVYGWVDYERGRVVVEDRGRGFDPDAEHPGHFGLTGMRERANRINARLAIVPTERGTSVALEWGEQ